MSDYLKLKIIKYIFRLEKFDRDVDKGLSSELIIRTSDRKDGALYGCLAKNEYGSDERNVKLLVVGKIYKIGIFNNI